MMANTFDARQFQARLERLDSLLRQMDGSTDSATRAHLQEIVRATLELHGVGLERLLDLVVDAGETAPGLFRLSCRVRNLTSPIPTQAAVGAAAIAPRGVRN
jgi:hypothetical protein